MTPLSKILRSCVVLAAVSVGACSSPLANGPDQAFDINRQFPISVQPRMMTLRLPYNGQAELDQNMSGQLARFAGDYLSHGAGSISVSAPSAYPNASNLVTDRLVELGVGRNQIMAGGVGAPGPVDDIRVTYIRYVAESPDCGDWSSNLTHTASNTVSPNFGCATQHNIAAMVADPRDLLAPQPAGQADAQRRLTVIDNYRKGAPTPAQKTEEQSGAVSSVAKQ